MLTSNVVMGKPNTGFILSEGNGQRSRENGLVPFPNVLAAGTVIKAMAAVALSTTADYAEDGTAVTDLASVAGLVVGQSYGITGAGIPADTKLTYGPAANTGTLSKPATAAGANAAVVISHPAGLQAWAAEGETPLGILLYNIDASVTDMGASYIARDAEVNKKALVYPDGEDPTADLADIGIIVRD